MNAPERSTAIGLLRPALTPEEWAKKTTTDGVATIREDGVLSLAGEADETWDPHGLAALCLFERPFGFTRFMVEAIYTLLWFSGSGGICQRCSLERDTDGKMEGGTGIKGDPQCVVTCSECGWFPREDGWVREHASQAAQAMDALLPREGVER